MKASKKPWKSKLFPHSTPLICHEINLRRHFHTFPSPIDVIFNTYDMRPPRNATGLPPISLIFRWHESNRPEVVVGAVAVGPMMCAGDRNILTRLLKPSIFVNVLKTFFVFVFWWIFFFLNFNLKKKIKVLFCPFLLLTSLPFTWFPFGLVMQRRQLCVQYFLRAEVHTSANFSSSSFL